MSESIQGADVAAAPAHMGAVTANVARAFRAMDEVGMYELVSLHYATIDNVDVAKWASIEIVTTDKNHRHANQFIRVVSLRSLCKLTKLDTNSYVEEMITSHIVEQDYNAIANKSIYYREEFFRPSDCRDDECKICKQAS